MNSFENRSNSWVITQIYIKIWAKPQPNQMVWWLLLYWYRLVLFGFIDMTHSFIFQFDLSFNHFFWKIGETSSVELRQLTSQLQHIRYRGQLNLIIVIMLCSDELNSTQFLPKRPKRNPQVIECKRFSSWRPVLYDIWRIVDNACLFWSGHVDCH